MKKMPKTEKAIIKDAVKRGLTHVGTIKDVTTGEGVAMEDSLDRQIADAGLSIHLVKVGKKCWVFSGPNPNGSRFIHKLPRRAA